MQVSLCQKEAKTRKNRGRNRIHGENGRMFSTFCGIWGHWSRTREAWQQSCGERLKTEQEVLVLAEELKAQGSVDENIRAMIIRGLKHIRKKKKTEH